MCFRGGQLLITMGALYGEGTNAHQNNTRNNPWPLTTPHMHMPDMISGYISRPPYQVKNFGTGRRTGRGDAMPALAWSPYVGPGVCPVGPVESSPTPRCGSPILVARAEQQANSFFRSFFLKSKFFASHAFTSAPSRRRT